MLTVTGVGGFSIVYIDNNGAQLCSIKNHEKKM